ncbi:DUF262 domain-containing protein [Pseudoalteromonas sp. OFAV1]|uniref:DUF262 domain-containing protein n=1 Tax=Pseudoalteromonas sp. OFAV1 TaxID=2908892 RepID=UPI001F41780F|nr:DUF262 domain-containing protein [Pseudoalteromonas sp. OFAV1]MCF2903325.1 DUF262 domain-containing protein [Pseudoalteromonas sp. OFAV1]
MSLSERFPNRIDTGRSYQFDLETIYRNFQKHLTWLSNPTPENQTHDTSDRYTCGFPIPDFQREPCWSVAQEVKFIESLILQLPIGNDYIVHETGYNDDGSPAKYSGWLVDGQNRLLSLEKFWSNKFPVFGFYWKDLTRAEQLRFFKLPFPQRRLDVWDYDILNAIYEQLAFGGVPHKK